jgi:gamma-glutamylcyclotransferase (GGCT)/AIG2-like uncharacterized protein YtfP
MAIDVSDQISAEIQIVYGERYRIPPHLLLTLDQLEEHPHVYQRRWLPLISGESAWIYLGTPAWVQGSRRIRSGCWKRYLHQAD